MAVRTLLKRVGSAVSRVVETVRKTVTRRPLTPEEKAATPAPAPTPTKTKTTRTPEGIEKEKKRKSDRNRSKSSAVGQSKGSSYPSRKQMNAAKRKAGGGQAKSAQRPQSGNQKKSAAQRAAEKTRSNATGIQKKSTTRSKRRPIT